MGYAVYERQGRDMGYGVPALCDQPDCNEHIDRGLAYLCGLEPGGDEYGCGLYFCSAHIYYGEIGSSQCDRCYAGEAPYEPTPDLPEWVNWKLTDESWQQWRDENPNQVRQLKEIDADAK